MTDMLGPQVRVGKRSSQSERNKGSAMTAGGASLAGLGVIGGGVPGVKEPKGLEVFNLRGATKKQRPLKRELHQLAEAAGKKPDPRQLKSPLHRQNLKHNVKLAAPLPKAGILGFRASVHQGMVDEIEHNGRMGTDQPKPTKAYDKGRMQGMLESEKKVVRGMRIARRGTYGLTAAGGALALAGHRKTKANPVEKRETQRERGVEAGAGGAAAGTVAGTYAGLRVGPEVGVRLADRKIVRDYVNAGGKKEDLKSPQKGWKVRPGTATGGESNFVRTARGLSRGLKGGAAVGSTLGATAGYHLARGEKVDTAKRDRFEEHSATAAGLGAGLATTGTVVPAGLKRFSRGYSNSAKKHVLSAQKLVPELGGLETLPEKRDPQFGTVRRKAKQTMYPEVRGEELGRRLERSKAPAAAKHQAGKHRQTATQERHFVEVMDNTARGFKRVRGPGLALAGAGGAALLGAKGKRELEQHQAATRRRKATVIKYSPNDARAEKLRRNDKTQLVGGTAGAIGGALMLRGRRKAVMALGSTPGLLTATQAGYDLNQDEYGWSPETRERRRKAKLEKAWKPSSSMTPEQVKALLASRPKVPKQRTWQSSEIKQVPTRLKGDVAKAWKPKGTPLSLDSVVAAPNKKVLLGSKSKLKARANGKQGHRYQWPEDVYGDTQFKAVDGDMFNQALGRVSRYEKRDTPVMVGKAVTYGYMERKRNKRRTAQLGVGAGAMAYGASRIEYAPHVGRGVREKTRQVTGQSVTHLRRIPGMGTALDVIPKKMRPGFALAGGAHLAARALPTHDERFVATQRGSW